MTCNNEWDQLKEVIVGVANTSGIPTPTTSFMSCVYPEYEKQYIETLVGTWRQEILKEQIDDLEILSKTLEHLGIKVYRPEIGMSKLFDWHWHCPRDLTLIIGNKIIETSKLLADPIKYNDMRNICDSYYCKITSNIPEYVKYDSERQLKMTSFTWWAHGNHIFFNETKKK